MAVTSYPSVTWGDDHTYYLSQLYTLYCKQINWGDQLCDSGYEGYPDPKFEDGSTEFKPDLFAYGENGDVQHFAVVPFLDINKASAKSPKEEQIEEKIEELEKYQNITNQMVLDYLEPWGEQPDLRDNHEIVILIREDFYQDHQTTINSKLAESDITLWLTSKNGSEKIWLEKGSHTNMGLEAMMEGKIEAYPGGNDLLQFSRGTDRKYLIYEFVQRLVKFCSRERQRAFHFSEIDDIMTEQRPRMLWQLSTPEREEYWKDFIYSLLNTHSVIEQTENQNEYRWKKQKFQSEPRYRKKILKELREDLGI